MISRQLELADREVGDHVAPFVIAEIQINHNGNLGVARSMIEATSVAGTDGVKFQTYKTRPWSKDNSYYEIFKNAEISDIAALRAPQNHAVQPPHRGWNYAMPAGRLVCNSCGAPLGPNVRRRQSLSSRKFQLSSKLKLRWLIILAIFAISLLIVLM